VRSDVIFGISVGSSGESNRRTEAGAKASREYDVALSRDKMHAPVVIEQITLLYFQKLHSAL
jgi:hypothetical protein